MTARIDYFLIHQSGKLDSSIPHGMVAVYSPTIDSTSNNKIHVTGTLIGVGVQLLAP